MSVPRFSHEQGLFADTPQPPTQHDLIFTEAVARWDEAIPLGNGLLGALVWGDGAPLRLSLDRSDLWDLRPVPDWENPDYNYATMPRRVAARRRAAQKLDRDLGDGRAFKLSRCIAAVLDATLSYGWLRCQP